MAASDLLRAETETLVTAPPVDFRDGERVGPYLVHALMGKGGVGAVYRAEVVESCSVPMGREVAIKVLKTPHLDPVDRRRFEREATYLQALQHPGIVRVHDVGEHGGRPYLVMELVAGRSLDDLIVEAHGEPLPPDAACDVLIQALEALHVAHLAGITHRDIKPGNLMVTPSGRVKILDFGMAQRMGQDSRLTASGSVLGTPAYMSPEQARGSRDEIGTRSDVYGMGAVLYELVTGRQPFRAENSVALLRAILEEPLTPPRAHVPTLSRDLETVILRAMAKDRRDRYRSAEAMAADLRRLRRGARIHSARPGRLRPLLRRLHYHRRLLTSAGLVLFVVGVVATSVIRRTLHLLSQQESRAREQEELEARLEATWLEVWRYDGNLADGPVLAQAVERSGRDQIAYLPVGGDGLRLHVSSGLRLRFDLVPRGPETRLEILFSDRTLGQGYSLLIAGRRDDAESWQVSLRRHRSGWGSEDDLAEMTAMAIEPLPAGEAVAVELSRKANRIRCLLDKRVVLDWSDLVPLEGPDHGGLAWVVEDQGTLVRRPVVERRRQPELISRLEVADATRQDGRYERAVAIYREFLRDFPDSPRARDARYRIGLCLIELGRDEEALELFQHVAAESNEDRLYYLAATFQSWSCALRLGRWEEADTYYGTIRNRYAIETVFSSVSRDTIRDLPRKYLDRAAEIAGLEPHRALQLLLNGAEIGEYLEQRTVISRALLGAGDILVGLGRYLDARETYRRVYERPDLARHEQMAALLRLGQAERLLGNDEAAITAFAEVMENPTKRTNQSGWARLYLGDLHLLRGQRDEAERLWRGFADRRHPSGRIMHHILTGQEPAPVPTDGSQDANDVAYGNALWAGLHSRESEYEAHLQAAASLAPLHDWPAALAQELLLQPPPRHLQPDQTTAFREP